MSDIQRVHSLAVILTLAVRLFKIEPIFAPVRVSTPDPVAL